MESIKIEEIADELGMQSKELIKRVQLLYSDIKSSKSKVSQEVAQEIFNLIIYDDKEKKIPTTNVYSIDNINIHFSSQKIDITMLEKIASTYKSPTQKEFMIRSYNFSELSIVKILVAGLINLDIKKYVELKSSNKELKQLLENMNRIVSDVDFEDIDNQDALDNFRGYVNIHEPEVIYIEGVNDDSFKNSLDTFQYVKSLSKQGIEFHIGFTELSPDNVQKITEFFCEK